MKLVVKYLIITILFLTSVLSLSASELDGSNKATADSSIIEHFAIYYKVDSININPTYLDNLQNIHKILHYLKDSPKIDSITIYSWSSPEGGYAYNKRLSEGRAKAAKEFLLKNSPDSLKLNATMIKISPVAENWEGLIEIVEKEYYRSDRAKVLSILYNKTIGDETRKWRLQRLDGGRTWKYLVRRYMPRLRAAKWTCVWAEAINPVPPLPIPGQELTTTPPKQTVKRPATLTDKHSRELPFNIKPADSCDIINNETLLKDYLSKLKEDKWIRIWPDPKRPLIKPLAPMDSLAISLDSNIIDNWAYSKPNFTSPYEISPADTFDFTNFELMLDDYLTKLQEDKWIRIWPEPKAPIKPIELKDSLYTDVDGAIIPPAINMEPEPEKKPFYLAARTNMLYDLALVPHVGVDIYLGKNFSLSGNWMYSWWKNDNIHWYWRTYGGDAGIRYWFGKAANAKPLTGHHVGLYGQIITYDFELGGRGYLGDRWTYGGGLEYGYSLPIAKRLNIDFNLGFGYLGGEFKEYLPIDGHYVWQATKRRQYIGPTKGEISLVWQIGRGNTNAGKGGNR